MPTLTGRLAVELCRRGDGEIQRRLIFFSLEIHALFHAHYSECFNIVFDPLTVYCIGCSVETL